MISEIQDSIRSNCSNNIYCKKGRIVRLILQYYWKCSLHYNIDIQNNSKSTTGLGFCV